MSKPFNLEEAKSGRPLITRDGRDAKFIAHVPEATENSKLVVLIGEDIFVFYEKGDLFTHGSPKDLFMKTVKKTCYFNLWVGNEGITHWTMLPTPEAARQSIQVIKGVREVAIAIPIEIEE